MDLSLILLVLIGNIEPDALAMNLHDKSVFNMCATVCLFV